MLHRDAYAFASVAELYDRARPGYPDDAVEWLVSRLGLGEGRVVVDLAAGTGKLTRLLVPTGAHVVAVEPLAEMRAVLGSSLVSGQRWSSRCSTWSSDAISSGVGTGSVIAGMPTLL